MSLTPTTEIGHNGPSSVRYTSYLHGEGIVCTVEAVESTSVLVSDQKKLEFLAWLGQESIGCGEATKPKLSVHVVGWRKSEIDTPSSSKPRVLTMQVGRNLSLSSIAIGQKLLLVVEQFLSGLSRELLVLG